MPARDIANYIKIAASLIAVTETSGSLANQLGVAFDRLATGPAQTLSPGAPTVTRLRAMPMTCAVHVWTTDAGAGNSVTAKFKLEHSADNGVTDPWTEYTDQQGNASDITLGATLHAFAENTMKVNLDQAKRYIRVSAYAADMTVTAGSTVIGGEIIAGGEYENPAI